MAYAKFLVLLVKAVRELNTRKKDLEKTVDNQQKAIDQQQEKLENLEGIIAKMQKRPEKLEQDRTNSELKFPQTGDFLLENAP